MSLTAQGFAAQSGTITMTGVGQVGIPPNMATIVLGVDETGPTAAQALDQSIVRLQAIFAALATAGVAQGDMRTSQLSLQPRWQSQNSTADAPLKITGYLAGNLLDVTVRDLNELGQIVDAMTNAGVNRIDGIRFAIADPKPLLDRARVLAVKEAIRKAAVHARAANIAVGDILSIEETGSVPNPNYRVQALALDQLPIAEGDLTVSAKVTIVFELLN